MMKHTHTKKLCSCLITTWSGYYKSGASTTKPFFRPHKHRSWNCFRADGTGWAIALPDLAIYNY